MLDFDGINGEGAYCFLTLSGDALFGTTREGENSQGKIFSIPTDGGPIITLHRLNGINGASAKSPLFLAGEVLFGMCPWGGTNNVGAIFSIHKDGLGFKNIMNCKPPIFPNGNPEGSLIFSENILYGMSKNGGVNQKGNIFSIHNDGTGFKTLFEFNGANGLYPNDSLLLSGDILYGTTSQGGTYGYGIIFSIPALGGIPTALHNFNNTDGASPKESFHLVQV